MTLEGEIDAEEVTRTLGPFNSDVYVAKVRVFSEMGFRDSQLYGFRMAPPRPKEECDERRQARQAQPNRDQARTEGPKPKEQCDDSRRGCPAEERERERAVDLVSLGLRDSGDR